ncbi:hypothetical protein HRJ41_21460 [Pseudomonas sp. BF61]|uniref:hypothetical protein n=1 Tax=Pseudomonas sp. BF61 TaxID=2741068 RepID=UPI001C0CA421|nr:hypothetical protein [Pseudomonas sp. BF61]MBU4630042.1 hypothetical protein [Pseudomonas sp. BF61]
MPLTFTYYKRHEDGSWILVERSGLVRYPTQWINVMAADVNFCLKRLDIPELIIRDDRAILETANKEEVHSVSILRLKLSKVFEASSTKFPAGWKSATALP